MKTDKDKPWTWQKYKDGICTGCIGACCMMPVEVKASDLIRLGLTSVDEIETSAKKVAKKLIKEGIVSSYREGTDLFMLSSRSNGDCYYLHPKTRLCTVYEKRPEVCRKFPTEMGPRLGFCPVSK
jgi:Fe-S-cluster containining protein